MGIFIAVFLLTVLYIASKYVQCEDQKYRYNDKPFPPIPGSEVLGYIGTACYYIFIAPLIWLDDRTYKQDDQRFNGKP